MQHHVHQPPQRHCFANSCSERATGSRCEGSDGAAQDEVVLQAFLGSCADADGGRWRAVEVAGRRRAPP
eukprot:6198726-Amphidinium_carterae.1